MAPRALPVQASKVVLSPLAARACPAVRARAATMARPNILFNMFHLLVGNAASLGTRSVRDDAGHATPAAVAAG